MEGQPVREALSSGLATDAATRKTQPVASGVLDYFPDALVAVAEVSYAGNQQHNPGQPLHWDRSKSTDEADAMLRHFLERGRRDTDGCRHSAKMVWRALAILQKEIEAERNQLEQERAVFAPGVALTHPCCDDAKKDAVQKLLDTEPGTPHVILYDGTLAGLKCVASVLALDSKRYRITREA